MTAIQNIDIALIDTMPQIRTRIDADGIRDLAASIQKHGLLQPILVRPNVDAGDRFTVVAGHRRLAAMQRNKFKFVPALVTDIEEGTKTLEAQLAENLQRDDLSLSDVASSVRALFDAHGSQGEVAKVVNRSKPWVSKHLSLTDAKFDERVRELMTKDQCGDVEMLNGLNQLAKAANAAYFDFILADVRAGRMNRADVLEAVSQAKNKMKPPIQADDQDEGEESAGDQGELEVTTTPMKAPAIKLTPEQYAIFEEKGGMRWLLDLLTA
ncbi:MAG: ParB/RepB/Spo0J family partition protein [Rhizobacter sp.]|nr:ParB/RepB/Spo0J family partition protein [Rhizobacter sp.]